MDSLLDYHRVPFTHTELTIKLGRFALADFEKLKYWGSVDCYTGGTEHITRHVLYAFFWQNFLYEIGVVPTRDPFVRKMGSGLILDDTGKKMSKSSTNGVSPMQVIDEYGTDVARLHVHFLGGYEDNTPWTYDGINGITNLINRVWSLKDIIKGTEISFYIPPTGIEVIPVENNSLMIFCVSSDQFLNSFIKVFCFFEIITCFCKCFRNDSI